MRFVFIYQNFPGQFRHVACALADDSRHEVVGPLESVADIHARMTLHLDRRPE